MIINDPMGDDVWRHVLYAVCVVEAAALAAILVVVVVEPSRLGVVPPPWVRPVCAWGSLALMIGCGSAVIGWLRSLLPGRAGFNL